ncbi:MAG: hypothetical protein ACR2HP_07180 [Ilumatobacteraceae bacterium]
MARGTAWMIWIGEPPWSSISVTSSNPPMRLAMSGDGGPSSVVTTPTTSVSPCGVMLTTRSGSCSTCCTTLWVESETILPKLRSLVMTTKPIGWIGAVVPGGSTGRWMPRWPPWSRKERTDVKLPKSERYTPDLAPVGRASPTWAMTSPTWSGGTCTQSKRSTS